MRRVALPEELRRALEAYAAAGGVVEFIVYQGEPGDDPHEAAMRAAANELGLEWTATPRISGRPTAAEFVGRIESSAGVFDRPGPFLAARQAAGSFSMNITDGLLFAFTDPPYTLRARPDEADGWWDLVSRELFNNYQDVAIARWTDDWSTYFDAGHEWWGAYWWTVHNRAREWMVVVAASATD
jgi:hypothetical protein